MELKVVVRNYTYTYIQTCTVMAKNGTSIS